MHTRKWILAAAIAGMSAPALAENYTIDSDHTYPSLEFPHMELSIWRGKFNRTTGKIVLDRAARTGSVDISVDAASIDFGHDKMNEHALKAEWLDTAQYPTMTYQGKIQFKGDTPAAVDGKLTLRGVSKPLKLRINRFNCIQHPFYKKQACGADAEAELHRADFGMTKYSEGEAGKVRLRIQVEALKDD